MKLPTKTSLFVFVTALFFVFSNASFGQKKEVQVLPVDEAKQDASFIKFRSDFIAAAKRQDVKFLLDTLDRDVKGSFGGDSGIADFKRLWKLDRKNSLLWKELLLVLNNGGIFTKGKTPKNKEFCAPYSFTNFPENLDAFEHQMIFGNNVNLRERPNSAAAVVTKLSYNVVKVDYENSVKISGQENEYEWLKIETLGGKTGFVSADFVRSPIDYRGCFEKQNGKWKMTFFLAGD